MDECKAIRDALRDMAGVDSEETEVADKHPDGSAKEIKVVYRGTAREENVFAALNFRTGLRPRKCSLLVYRKQS